MTLIGIVVPTNLTRLEHLPLAIKSIRAAGSCHVLLLSPEPTADQMELVGTLKEEGLLDQLLLETPGESLPAKINEAVRSLPDDCDLIAWLGDDDLITPGSLTLAQAKLEAAPDAVMVYGGVDYIDKNGTVLFTNPSSQFHEKLLRFGPQLIPQPGALWRRSAFEEVGGLSNEFNLAFDFDLFLKLSKIGQLTHIDQTLAQFRWHPDSLSVKRRWQSATEASRVRRKHYSGLMRYLWVVWEPWVVVATWAAGKLVSVRARHLSRRRAPSKTSRM